ncbi:MAG: thioredoxin family protein [Candidatus Saccharicenans sp.]
MEKQKVKVSCFNCGQTNYYPVDGQPDLGRRVVCGRCHSPLPRPGDVLEVQPNQAMALISRSSLPVLVDFYSPSCGPCHLMAPVLERLARRRAGELMVIKINVDEFPQMAAQVGIQAVPTFIVFHKNVERGRMTGASGETDFALWVARLT